MKSMRPRHFWCAHTASNSNTACIGKCDGVQAFRTSKIKSDTGTRLRIEHSKIVDHFFFCNRFGAFGSVALIQSVGALAYKSEPQCPPRPCRQRVQLIGVRAVIVGVGDIQKRGESDRDETSDFFLASMSECQTFFVVVGFGRLGRVFRGTVTAPIQNF